jgi:hypothetical protein
MTRLSIIGTVCLFIGCGGGSSSGTGGHAGGSAGATGRGGTTGGAGGQGTGAGGASAKGGTSGALPACAITTRPADPTDATADAGFRDPRTHVCNAVDPTGPWVVPEPFTWGDAGAATDGGVPEAPKGGVVLDGDYDLVRYLLPGSPLPNPTRRTFRVFDGGTYIERAVLIQNPAADGGMNDYWYDTTETPSGTDFGSYSVCGLVAASDRYTADGDMLTLFVYAHGIDDPSPIGIDIYRRTCTRP